MFTKSRPCKGGATTHYTNVHCVTPGAQFGTTVQEVHTEYHSPQKAPEFLVWTTCQKPNWKT